jgi:hypothetical protein
MISETRYAQTPDGLHGFHLTFLDDDRNPVDDSIATQWRIEECDERGIPIGSSWGFHKKNLENLNY